MSAGAFTASEPVSATPGGPSVTLVVEGAVQLRVHLEGAARWQPSGHWILSANGKRVRSDSFAAVAIEVDRLDRGTYDLSVSTDDGEFGSATGIELHEDGELVLDLRAGRALHVRFGDAIHPINLWVADADGRLVTMRDSLVAPTTTVGIPAGPARVLARDGDGRRSEREVGGAGDVEIDVAF